MSLELLGMIEIGADYGDNMLAAFASSVTPSLAEVRAGKAQIRKGMKGEPVKYIQQKVSVPGGGEFGDKTEEAVKKIQAAYDLPTDGVVDKATLAVLDSMGVTVVQEVAPSPWGGVKTEQGATAWAPPAAPPVEKKPNYLGWGLLGAAALGITYAATRK